MTGVAKSQRQSILKGYMIRNKIPFKNSEIESMSRHELDREIRKYRDKYGKCLPNQFP